MRRLQLYSPGTIIELVPYKELNGTDGKGLQRLRTVAATWAMPGGGVKTTKEVIKLAEVNNLSINLVEKYNV